MFYDRKLLEITIGKRSRQSRKCIPNLAVLFLYDKLYIKYDDRRACTVRSMFVHIVSNFTVFLSKFMFICAIVLSFF